MRVRVLISAPHLFLFYLLLCFFCAFSYVDTIQRDEEDPHRVERRGLFGTTTYKRITRVIEHVWRYQVHWRISAYCGRLEDPANALELKRRSGYVDVKTRVHGVQLTGSGTGRGGKEALQVCCCWFVLMPVSTVGVNCVLKCSADSHGRSCGS